MSKEKKKETNVPVKAKKNTDKRISSLHDINKHFQQVEEIFDNIFGDWFSAFPRLRFPHLPERFDMRGIQDLGYRESDNGYEFSLDIGDMDKDNLDISVEDGSIRVSGKKHIKTETGETKTEFYQQYALPDIDEREIDEIKASLDKGKLTIKVPKVKQLESKKSPKQIEIQEEK